ADVQRDFDGGADDEHGRRPGVAQAWRKLLWGHWPAQRLLRLLHGLLGLLRRLRGWRLLRLHGLRWRLRPTVWRLVRLRRSRAGVYTVGQPNDRPGGPRYGAGDTGKTAGKTVSAGRMSWNPGQEHD